MPIAFVVVLAVVVGTVMWLAFHHAAPTSQIVKPAFHSPTIGSKPITGTPNVDLGTYITGEQEKGSYGL